MGRSIRPISIVRMLAACLLLSVATTLQATDADRSIANSYDNAWKTAWVTHLRAILTAQGGSHTSGFVIHIGDSITYANQYANRFAAAGGHTDATDVAVIAWSKAGAGDTSSPLPNNKNGWNLAKTDHPAGGRSFTASGGITTGQWLSGGGTNGIASGNGSTPDPNPIDTLIANSTTAPYPSGSTVAIVSDAQVVIIMLGTNDIGGGITAAAAKANLQTIATKFEAANIMVVLSTIPPRVGKEAEAIALNTEIKNLCIAMNLPMIDYHSEIMRRQPGTAWQTSLISGDGVHPSDTGSAFVDPDNTPSILDTNGYELRGFLSIAKLREIKSYVIDGNAPPGGGPTINTQPSDVTVNVGQTATFTVAATGTGVLSYQWKNGSTNVGTNSATYSIVGVSAGDAGSYSVIVTDSNGSTTSNTVTLTVNTPAPTITTQPSSTTVNQNQTATFTVIASGTGLSYAWRKTPSSTVIGTAATLSLPNAQGSTAGNYNVTVTNAGGSVVSNTVSLTVLLIPTISTQPASQSVVQPSTATFSVVATSTGLTYQWQVNSVDIGGATSSSYTTGITNTGMTGTQYRVVVTNGAGSVTSNQATLTVTATAVPPTITTHPANATVNAGQTATFSVVASGTAPFTYQWSKNSSPIGGATSSSYTTPATTTGDNGSVYSVVVTNSAGSATSNNATLTVNGSSNPVTVSVSAISLGAPVGSSTSVTTTVTVTNTSGGAITVTPTSSVTFITTSGAVTIPAGSSVTVSITGDPTGKDGIYSANVTFTNSTGGTQTIPVSFTIGVTTGQKKRSCAISSSANPDALMWAFGLIALGGVMVVARKQA